MKIKTKLYIIAILSIGLSIAVGLTLFLTNRQVTKGSDIALMSNLVVKGVAELEIVTYDYLLNHEERAKKQWLSKYASLSKLLKAAEFMSPEKRGIMENVFHHHEAIKTIFTQLVTTHQKMHTLNQKTADIYRELEERLTSQLLLRLQTVISGAFRFGEASHAGMVAAQQWNSLLIIGLVAIMTAVISVILFFISRSFVGPIAQLQEGTEIVGTGNLDYRVGTDAKDEIGQLSRAFDKMSERLKTTTVSRNRLIEEVAQRKRAEERLGHLNLLLHGIRRVNQLITREKDRNRLLQEICKTLIKTRSYYNIWIALFDESRTLVTTAEAGLGEDFRPMVEQLKHGKLPYCGLKALGQSDAVAIENSLLTCTDCPLAHKYEGRGAMCIRLEHDGKVYGLLSISTPREFVSDRENRALLKDVAGDIAFALHNMEVEGKQRRTEKALQQSEERYRDLVEESFDGIFIQKGSRIIFANRRLYEMLGYDEGELLGIDHWLVYHPEYQELTRERARTRMQGERVISQYEVKLQRKDGSWFYGEISARAIEVEGEPGIQVWVKDIMERKQAEEEKERLRAQFQQAQKMETIGTLAGGIAHDFNNILTSILGYAELASYGIPEGTDIKKNIKEVIRAGNRARDLVKQILSFSRRSKEERRPISIGPIVREALKLLRSSIPTTIEIRQEIATDAGVVEADPTQIHQVLMNLGTNAAHAMRKEGGVLEVKLKNVELDSDFAAHHPDIGLGSYLRLTVSDTGEGMTPDVMERIFDPYFTTKEKGIGTGLGLAVVSGIVKDHGGTITVHSEHGKGSTFHVYLPIIKSIPDVEEKEAAEILPTGNERIFIIDDEKALVDLGRQMLERLGYEVTSRTSSLEALELFRLQPDRFDLVITDMTMPQMTGDRLAQELMKIRPDIPVILCTGFSERITEEKAKGLGIRAFAMKPLVGRDLANIVRKVLDVRRGGRP